MRKIKEAEKPNESQKPPIEEAFILNQFPPDGWKLPERDFFAENGVEVELTLPEYFAMLLLLGKIPKSLTPKVIEQIANQISKCEDELKKKGVFFHPDGGSIFMDFKHWFHWAILKAGGYSGQLPSCEQYEEMKKLIYGEAENKELYKEVYEVYRNIHKSWKEGMKALEGRFNPEMTIEQAREAAMEIVEEFWW